MATCPRCGGHLTSTHRCGPSRTRLWIERALATAGGAILALLVAAILDRDDRLGVYNLAVAAGGALIGAAVHSLARR